MRKIYFLVLILSLSIISCNKEDNDSLKNPLQKEFKEEGVIKGVYHFSSKESLAETIEKMKNNKPLLEKTMKNLYLEGFRSNSPVGDIENDAQLIRLNERRTVTTGRNPIEEEFDENENLENNLISDPVLSTFVNEQNEIAINDTLYKFTNRGIFSAHLKDADKMLDYISNLPSSEPTEQEISQLRENFSGRTQVSEGIYRFIAPITENEKSSMTSRPTPWYNLYPIINNLPVSNGSNNWFLHTITGTSKVAVEHFDRRHRVKVEYFNQNYGFYKSIGVSVRNQVRRFRIWWASEADEVVLGINYAYMIFKIPTAPVNDPNFYFNNSFAPKPVLYSINGNVSQYDYNYSFIRDNLNLEKILIPFIKIDNEDILNIYIPKVPVIGGTVDLTLKNEHIFSQNNIKKLYEKGFDLLKSVAPNYNNGLVVVKEGNTSDRIEVVYLSEGFQYTNTNKYKKHFDTDFGGVITFKRTMGGHNGSTNNYSGLFPSPIELREYEKIKIDFYGMARRGGTWKGARIIYEE